MEETLIQGTKPGVPGWGTSFVERGDQLRRLGELLSRPECRLVSILGPGGVGKTRLAAEFVRENLSPPHCCFVQLESSHDLEGALLYALAINSDGPGGRAQRIATAIGETEFILVLDNMEHLVEQSGLFSTLLAACPALKIVTTSRQTLGIGEEWLLPLDGLPLTATDSNTRSPALQLFATRFEQSAGRPLEGSEDATANRICTELAGVPLALELAAAWGDTLSVEEIASELERGSGLLAARGHSIPQRQRSVRAVFEHSWALLSSAERTSFTRLGVFHDGFVRGDAVAVSGLDRHAIASLVAKSLLRRDPSGRFRLHPLALEFARERLDSEPGERERLLDRHARVYLDYLRRAYPDVDGHHQLRAVAYLDREWSNIRAAWSRALTAGWFADSGQCLYILEIVSFFRARYDEAYEFAMQALAATDEVVEGTELRFVALVYLSWLHVRWGDLTRADELATEAREILEGLPDLAPPVSHLDPGLPLATARLAQGEFAAAVALAEASVARARRIGDEALESLALYTLENAHWELANFAESSRALDAAAALSSGNGDDWFLAHLHLDLARRAVRDAKLGEAEAHLARSIEIRTAFGDGGGLAAARVQLANVLLVRQEFEPAEQQLIEALRLFRQAGDRGGVAASQAALGRVALQRGEAREAQSRFLQALESAREMGYSHLVADVLLSVGEMSHKAGDAGGLSLIAYLAEHSATPAPLRGRINAIASGVPPERWSAAKRGARSLTQATVMDAAAASLRRPAIVADLDVDGRVATEALSPREREVLRMIATGASNAEIAASLGVKLGTAKWHTSQLYARLGAANRTEAVARARERDLLP